MSGLKSNFEQLKWVFIDLDDTLWDFTANSANALHILYHRVPVLQQLYADYSEYDEAYHFKNAELWNLYHHGEITQEFLKIERFRWLLCRKNIECTVEEALRQNDLYLSILGEQTLLVDGAVELLEYLSKRYLIGIISNGFLNIQYKKLYATDLNKYIHIIKIDKAKDLLKDHSKNITQISNYLGYSSSSHFNRIFKQITKTTPNEYRKTI